MESLNPLEAMGQFMKSGAHWQCRAVASVHPRMAFEVVDGAVPALWLGSPKYFDGFEKNLIERLKGSDVAWAVTVCSKHMTAKALDALRVCMTFESRQPQRARDRRQRKEAELAMSLSEVLRCASSAGASSLTVCMQAQHGIQEALSAHVEQDPSAAWWVRRLGWESMPTRALALAERMELVDQAGPEVESSSPRRL